MSGAVDLKEPYHTLLTMLGPRITRTHCYAQDSHNIEPRKVNQHSTSSTSLLLKLKYKKQDCA